MDRQVDDWSDDGWDHDEQAMDDEPAPSNPPLIENSQLVALALKAAGWWLARPWIVGKCDWTWTAGR